MHVSMHGQKNFELHGSSCSINIRIQSAYATDRNFRKTLLDGTKSFQL